MDERPDPYVVLGVRPDASDETIREAYRALAKASHPDLVGDDGLRAMSRLNTAWDLIRDPVRRTTFDAGRAAEASASATAKAASNEAARESSQPAWTGGAGPPPGRPSGSGLDFGLYAGWTIGEIARHDGGYLVWMLERKEGRRYQEEVRTALDLKGDGKSDSGSRWGR